MKGRLYDPGLARFITPDPVINDILLSASYNPYSYSFNNPQTWRDPTGFDPESQDLPAPPATGTAGTTLNSIDTNGSAANVPGASDNGVDPQSARTVSCAVVPAPAALVSANRADADDFVLSCVVGTQVTVPPTGLHLTPVPEDTSKAGEAASIA